MLINAATATTQRIFCRETDSTTLPHSRKLAAAANANGINAGNR